MSVKNNDEKKLKRVVHFDDAFSLSREIIEDFASDNNESNSNPKDSSPNDSSPEDKPNS